MEHEIYLQGIVSTHQFNSSLTPSIFLFIPFLAFLFIYLFIYLIIYSLVYLFIHLFIYFVYFKITSILFK